jgi:hypothetical protein
MKLMTKEEKILKEGLEKVSEKKDNMDGISSLAFFNSIGCSPFWAKVKFALSLAYYRITAFLIPISKSARLQSSTHLHFYASTRFLSAFSLEH